MKPSRQENQVVEFNEKMEVLKLPSTTKTLANVFKAKTPCVNAIFRQFGADNCIKFLADKVITTTEMLNVKRQMSVNQVAFLANHIINEYGLVPIGVILRALKQGIVGRKGEIFSSLDPATICKWIDSEYEEYLEVVEMEREKEHLSIKNVPIAKDVLGIMLEAKTNRSKEIINVVNFSTACEYNDADIAEVSANIRSEIEKYCSENVISKQNISKLVELKKMSYFRETLYEINKKI